MRQIFNLGSQALELEGGGRVAASPCMSAAPAWVHRCTCAHAPDCARLSGEMVQGSQSDREPQKFRNSALQWLLSAII